MSKEITCTYVATAPTAQSMSGTIKLTGCDPAIGNDQTLNSSDVIFIVAGIVLFGLVAQWAMLWLRKHLDNEALMTLRADLRTVKADLGHVVRAHPDQRASNASYQGEVKSRTTTADAEQLAAALAKAPRKAKD